MLLSERTTDSSRRLAALLAALKLPGEVTLPVDVWRERSREELQARVFNHTRRGRFRAGFGRAVEGGWPHGSQ